MTTILRVREEGEGNQMLVGRSGCVDIFWSADHGPLRPYRSPLGTLRYGTLSIKKTMVSAASW